VAKPEWGTKRVCQSCGTRFYDLMRTPCTCPKCGAAVETEVVFKPRRQSASDRAAAKIAPAAEIGAAENEEVEAMDDEEGETPAAAEGEDDSLMEDVADLGEDDDDMAEVMEHLDDEDMQGEV
jgi:uncharacterized protein (TIGR02300 family)